MGLRAIRDGMERHHVRVTHARNTARLFVAIDPPPEVCEELTEWARAAVRGLKLRGDASPVRVLDPESLHLTLCFLGERPVGEIEAIGEALASCAVAVGELRTGAPLWLPPRRPRALAVEVHEGSSVPGGAEEPADGADENAGLEESADGADEHGLDALHDELLDALGRVCGLRQERRLRAHITLARMRDMRRRDARARGYGIERPLPATPALSFTPQALILYRSRLSDRGASYEALASHTLVPA